MTVGSPVVRLHRDSEGRTRKKVYEAALHGAAVFREHGAGPAIEFCRSSKYHGNKFAAVDAFLAMFLLEAFTESEVLEGIRLTEAVRASTTGVSPSRVLESPIGEFMDLAVASAWVIDLGDPRKALEVLQRSTGSSLDNSYRPAVLNVRVFLAQVDPGQRSEGVKLASELLLAGSDWLMQFDEPNRGEAANAMALALVQVPISEGPLISEAERLAVLARDSSCADRVSTTLWGSATDHTLALVRIRQGRIEEAVSLLQPTLADKELTPRHYDEVLLTLALALTKLGKLDDVVRLLEGGRRGDLKPSVLNELRESLVASGLDMDAI
jgi:hypothetical protein